MTTTLALTDRDTIAGTERFVTAVVAGGMRLHLRRRCRRRPLTWPDQAAGRPRTPALGGACVIEPPPRITLLEQNATGWATLCRQVSAAHAEADGAAPVVSGPASPPYAEQERGMLLSPASEPVRATVRRLPRRHRAAMFRLGDSSGPIGAKVTFHKPVALAERFQRRRSRVRTAAEIDDIRFVQARSDEDGGWEGACSRGHLADDCRRVRKQRGSCAWGLRLGHLPQRHGRLGG
ncbi:hypothetical protein FB563_6560 [Streptomyces puniciscabiei]|uniref:Uncharacterized protein n=1 Tax=Streptomyces puniciscabiei TaxID=164348 RepID=A0A542TI12_9ACTN|nr:hypothetical protein FB563_6560 [Streptomyces puniciscabiei]